VHIIVIEGSAKVLLAFLFSLSALGPIHPSFLRKNMDGWMDGWMMPRLMFDPCHAHFGLVMDA